MSSLVGSVVDYTTASRGNIAALIYSVAIPASIVECALSASVKILSSALPIGENNHQAIDLWLNESATSIAISTYNTAASVLGMDPTFCNIQRKLSLPQKLSTQKAFDDFISAIAKNPKAGLFVKEVIVGSMTYADIKELARLCPKIEILDLTGYNRLKESDYKCIKKLRLGSEENCPMVFCKELFRATYEEPSYGYREKLL